MGTGRPFEHRRPGNREEIGGFRQGYASVSTAAILHRDPSWHLVRSTKKVWLHRRRIFALGGKNDIGIDEETDAHHLKERPMNLTGWGLCRGSLGRPAARGGCLRSGKPGES